MARSKHGSVDQDYGDHTTARKRRLMLLEDAATSSVNGNKNSLEFGSQAGRTSVLSGLRQNMYMSLGSVVSPQKQSAEKVILKQNSEVEIGAGQINDENGPNDKVQLAYAHWSLAAPKDEPELRSSGTSQLPKRDKSRKVLVLKADSEIDSASQRPSILGYYKSDFSSPNNNNGSTAFEKLVQAANKITDRNGKRSHSVNQVAKEPPKKAVALFKVNALRN